MVIIPKVGTNQGIFLLGLKQGSPRHFALILLSRSSPPMLDMTLPIPNQFQIKHVVIKPFIEKKYILEGEKMLLFVLDYVI